MTTRYISFLIIIGIALNCAACGGGNGNGQPQPQPSEIHALYAVDGSVRVSAGPGSADPSSPVEIIGGGQGGGSASQDGSFSFDAQVATGSGPPSTLTVGYSRSSMPLTAIVVIGSQSSLISLNSFSTGAGPNDLLYANSSLFVASSLDNSVVRYGLDGTEYASQLFAEFSSPSHLAADLTHLYCVSNGSNRLTRMSLNDLSFNAIQDVFQLSDPAAVFIGPAAPAVYDDRVYVPRSQVLEFPEFGSGDPTTYGSGLFTEVDFRSVAPTGQDFKCIGHNPQFVAYNSARNLLVVVSGGELNFTADFTPYVSTSSYLEFYSTGRQVELLDSLELGMIGAGAIAFSGDGGTAYLGNSINGNLYKVDIAGRQVLRGESSPIVLTAEFTYISDVELSADGRYLLATSFNTDELYIVPTATDTPGTGPYPGPLDMSQGSDLLAGAAALELDGNGHAWVLNGLANSVNRIDLLP